ncbi:MAG: sigma-70 family RNA polymerase sigma factor [Pyrinomonadaceae bacterium]
MVTTSTHQVTELLRAWSAGDREALERLTPIVHAELHRIARRYLSKERPGHTLQPTALVNEAYIRLIDWNNVRWENRAHFFGVSAQLMRRILVDFARRRPHLKNVEIRHVAVDEAFIVPDQRDPDLVALDEALTALAEIDERKARIVELRFFGGLTFEEAAEVMNLSKITIVRDWNKAKVWLFRELSLNAGHES